MSSFSFARQKLWYTHNDGTWDYPNAELVNVPGKGKHWETKSADRVACYVVTSAAHKSLSFDVKIVMDSDGRPYAQALFEGMIISARKPHKDSTVHPDDVLRQSLRDSTLFRI